MRKQVSIMNNFIERLQSRKFLLAVGFGVFVAVNKYFELNMSDKEMQQILVVVVGYLVAEGSADVVKQLKK